MVHGRGRRRPLRPQGDHTVLHGLELLRRPDRGRRDPTPFVAGIAQAEPRGPQDDPATDPQSVTIAQLADGGPRSYDNAYWQALDVQQLMPRIVANGIPALTEAGWNDLFPGSNLGDYVAAQNAYFHRPLTAPITAHEPTTGRYQAIVGPWTHGEK